MVALATLGVTTGLRAQHGNAYEFGFFGSYTRYDPAFGLPERVGGGIRLGRLFGDLVQVEAEVLFPSEYTVNNTTVDPLIGSASLIFNVLHSQRNILYLLGGYSRLEFGNANPYDFSDNGAHAAIGDRIFLSRNMALRLEGRGIYTPSTQSNFGKESVTHFVGTVGLSIFAPTRASKKAAPPPAPAPVAPAAAPAPTPPLLLMDSDQDGVQEKDDACPNTPLGAKVDTRGCSLDTDRDGVPDGLDRCPDTPAGAIVDITGCAGDADHDGVPEGVDRCPNTPAGATVDATGCSGDADHDGVMDGVDQCPDTPVGAVVDATGCTTDADLDGVRDWLDKCPETPLGATVDATGCPKDSDGDGVVDAADKCPGTPKGVPVDETGCMILFQREVPPVVVPGAVVIARPTPRPTLVLRGVTFETGKSILTPGSYVVLDQVAASLRANPEIRIEVAGYTDNTGSADVNLHLSQGRAAAVRTTSPAKASRPARSRAGTAKESHRDQHDGFGSRPEPARRTPQTA
jgi:hypothetical protein